MDKLQITRAERVGTVTPKKEKAHVENGLENNTFADADYSATLSAKPLTPTSTRQLRALKALSTGAKMRYDLDGLAGTTNAPECVRQLRRLGWPIITERVEIIDRDGCVTRVGRYHLAPEHIPLARGVTL